MKCKVCGKRPDEIEEYVEMANDKEGFGCDTPEEVVIREEGTYNSRTGLFYCTDCYIKIGMPLGTA
jgi:hypothetical protein